MYQGSLTTEKRADRNYQVEFRDVSFRYPGSDRWALRHVDLKFRIGSRLAVVGPNGSGKTTFIKLLCRLYDPTEGEILLNGIDIRKYRYQDYIGIFSVVFQDFRLLALPLGENVAGAAEYDRGRAARCLADAGFETRLDAMPKGLDTSLYKDLDKEGVNVSGGEAQKIAIARALYKDAPFIVLDEPPPRWTPSPRPRSTPGLTPLPATRPPSISATGCPAASSATRSRCLTRGPSSRPAATTRWWPTRPGCTTSCGTPRRSTTRRKRKPHPPDVLPQTGICP